MKTIDDVLQRIAADLNMTRETEYELLDELRTHLEDAVDAGKAAGYSDEVALLKAAEQFGVADVAPALRDVHQPWESTDAILACIIPVVAALVLRWLVFAPDGTVLGWQQVLARPALWVVAFVVLIVPLLQWRQWRLALVSWGFFWTMTIIFIIFPNIQNW